MTTPRSDSDTQQREISDIFDNSTHWIQYIAENEIFLTTRQSIASIVACDRLILTGSTEVKFTI